MKELSDQQLEKEIEELGINYCARAAYIYNRKTGGITYESMREELERCRE